MLINYFKKTGLKRFIIMFLGNLIIALGIAFFRDSGFGTDPFNGMNMSVSALLPISYPAWQACLNIVLLIIVFFKDKHFIGIGTIVNGLLIGYFVNFFTWIIQTCHINSESLALRFVYVGIGVIGVSFGLSWYQKSDVGMGPYDALPIILHNNVPKIPYFWCRMMFDATCVILSIVTGGVVGIGTVLTALCLGPFISFFNKHFTEPVFHL